LILPVLTELFNYILTSSTLSLVWKIASVIFIPKVHSPTEKSDYRPISVLPVPGKGLLKCYVRADGKLRRPQWSYFVISVWFSLFHSTATTIARVSDEIRLNMESNQPKILVLLDFSKAFASVCHGLFILKLRRRYGFHAMAAATVSSYLFPRYACGNDVSPLAPSGADVPQDIATLFFSVY
jgi:hypothetical protein